MDSYNHVYISQLELKCVLRLVIHCLLLPEAKINNYKQKYERKIVIIFLSFICSPKYTNDSGVHQPSTFVKIISSEAIGQKIHMDSS